MTRIIVLKTVKASTSKPNRNPPPGDLTFSIDPDILFYKIEDGDNTEEGEDEEILVIYDSIITASK